MQLSTVSVAALLGSSGFRVSTCIPGTFAYSFPRVGFQATACLFAQLQDVSGFLP